jgi:hypothetical protein
MKEKELKKFFKEIEEENKSEDEKY